MAELEQNLARDYSFQQYEVAAGLLIGPYLIRYSGREGSDLFFRLSVFDHSNRYSEQQPITVKLCLSESFSLLNDGVEYSIKPQEVCSEVDLDIHATWKNSMTGEDLGVTTLKDVLLPKLSEVPLMSERSFNRSNDSGIQTLDQKVLLC
ncbi:hypothetical protein HYU96_04785 [Candidatus Daviesbacteria bacterium]|nr:hypothetical protein [Candidatus Daviesbacteria bacterium]